jgi:hypothetical protein
VDDELVPYVFGAHDEAGWTEWAQSHHGANLKLGPDVHARQMK